MDGLIFSSLSSQILVPKDCIRSFRPKWNWP